MSNRFSVTSPTFTRGRNTLNERRLNVFVSQKSKWYSGYFAVIPAEDAADGTKQIKIIDNANPDAGIAGYTDLSDDPVPAVTLAAHSGRLFLFASWQEEANEYQITFGFSSSPEKSGFMYIELASLTSIDNRFSIYQRWRRNETACFGERYWI